jgi:hypothetical protein
MMEVWVLSISSNSWTEHSVRSVYSSKESGVDAIKKEIKDWGIEPDVEKLEEYENSYEVEVTSLHNGVTWTLTKCEVK